MREFKDGLGSVRVAPPPKKTIKAYKLMRLQNGEVYPLFIDRSEPLKIGVWYDADSPNLEFLRSLDEGMHLIGENRLVKSAKSVSVSDVKKATSNGQRWILIKAAKSARRFGENRSYYNIGISESKGKETVSLYSLRPGWHAGSLPTMRQIGIGKDRNIRAEEQVWTEVELSADIDYTPEAQRNPDKDLPGQMPVNGYYMKATNANAAKSQADKVGWYIAGAMKIVRLVGDKEAREIINNFNKKTGLKVEHDYRRESGRDFEVNLGGIMGKITKDNMSEYLDEVAKYANAEFLPLYKDAIDMLEFYDEDADIKENVDMTIEYANELLEKNAPKKEGKGSKTEDSKKEAEELEEWKKYISEYFKDRKTYLDLNDFNIEAEIKEDVIEVSVSVKNKKQFSLDFKEWIKSEFPDEVEEHIEFEGNAVIWQFERVDGKTFKEMCDKYTFTDIQDFLSAEKKKREKEEAAKPQPEKKPKKVSKPKAEKKPKAKKEDNAERVAAITPEKKIIGDFCKLASFSGTASALKDKVRLLLNRLQNAIVQKQIRKTSKYANEIMSIQTKLVSFLNSGATGKVKVEIDNLDELMKIAKSEKVSENVMIARAFIRLNNKSDKMKEATALLKRINKAIEADIANEEVKMLKPSLESFISKKTKAVEPSERALRGLYGLAGVEDGAAANSMQLINQHYDVMTLSGRWKDFIGRPSKNFKMMVYGKPGQGKSTFSILLARYLAKEKGLRVLYVAAEEKFGYTLQEKIKRLEALTPNLDFAEDLTISDLPNYDVVLLDSVNHLQMDADELATLPQNCAYVWIFQATKEGNYKGGQQYAHDSDIVIKVDSMKARTEKNRFGATNVEFDIEDNED